MAPPASTADTYSWLAVTSETPGVGTFGGASGSYLQALRASDGANAGGKSMTAPAAPSVEFDLQVPTAGIYNLEVRAAGLGSSSDSLWVEIIGRSNIQGASRMNITTNSTRQFVWVQAGQWNLPAGTHTVRISMRESGTALDTVRLVDTALPPPPPEPATGGVIEAETFARRVDGPPASTSTPYRWFVIPTDQNSVGNFTGAVGPFLQALQASNGANAGGKSLSAPATPYIEYDVTVDVAGSYQLDVRAAGLNTSSDSLWVEILGAPRSGGSGALNVTTSKNGTFAWLNGGIWSLSAGTHTIRVSMREAGTGLDALRLTLQQ